jgi:hypothetical protein
MDFGVKKFNAKNDLPKKRTLMFENYYFMDPMEVGVITF